LESGSISTYALPLALNIIIVGTEKVSISSNAMRNSVKLSNRVKDITPDELQVDNAID